MTVFSQIRSGTEKTYNYGQKSKIGSKVKRGKAMRLKMNQ